MPKKIKEEVLVLNRECMDCGKKIQVIIDKKTKHILSGDWYYGKMRLGVGMWGLYTWKQDANGNWIRDKNGRVKFIRCISRFRELYYRLIDLKRTILHQYEDAEFWVCIDCVKAQYGTKITKRKKTKNPSKRCEKITVTKVGRREFHENSKNKN
jgi:hypothetical protein